MSKRVQYQTQGTCSRLIEVVVSDDGVIEDIRFEGGCNGNLKGVCKLVTGRKA
ncbi:MAG: TSCPD domain-containing protein, partial [Prevotella sp.]|nr:TSCPD domain-containing protein [Prevotella sp.]